MLTTIYSQLGHHLLLWILACEGNWKHHQTGHKDSIKLYIKFVPKNKSFGWTNGTESLKEIVHPLFIHHLVFYEFIWGSKDAKGTAAKILKWFSSLSKWQLLYSLTERQTELVTISIYSANGNRCETFMDQLLLVNSRNLLVNVPPLLDVEHQEAA